MKKFNALLLWISVLVVVTLSGSRASQAERKLLAELLHEYDVDVRPVVDVHTHLNIGMDLSLMQIVDLDEVNQILVSKVKIFLSWFDAHLTWDRDKHDGIEIIYITGSRIWLPDIILHNDVNDDRVASSGNNYLGSVRYDGLVHWDTSAVLKSSCSLDVTFFPWDGQSCPLKWGSIIRDIGTLDLHNISVSGDVSGFMINGEWDLIGFPVERRVDIGADTLEYPFLVFEVVMQRKALYYVTNLVLPCVFITTTILLVFMLPPESGEKVSLAVTILLATTIFLTMVAELMPAQSTVVPLIAIYFLCTMGLLSASCVVTVMILMLHHRGTLHKPVPHWVNVVVLRWMASGVFMRDIVLLNQKRHKEQERKFSTCEGLTDTKSDVNEAFVPDHKTEASFTQEPDSASLYGGQVFDSVISQRLKSILSSVRLMTYSIHQQKSRDRRVCEWMLVAQILDRVFLVIFFILIAVMHMAIFIACGTRG